MQKVAPTAGLVILLSTAYDGVGRPSNLYYIPANICRDGGLRFGLICLAPVESKQNHRGHITMVILFPISAISIR